MFQRFRGAIWKRFKTQIYVRRHIKWYCRCYRAGVSNSEWPASRMRLKKIKRNITLSNQWKWKNNLICLIFFEKYLYFSGVRGPINSRKTEKSQKQKNSRKTSSRSGKICRKDEKLIILPWSKSSRKNRIAKKMKWINF